jgi:RNA polymerase sigma-70 factor (ECF subfamily)
MRDPDGFDEFYRDTSARMVRYGYALTGDLAEAQDLVQEAYTRAWRQWRTVSVHPAPEAWIRLVVARLATDGRRRMRGWWAALSRSGPPEPARPPADDTVMVTAALRRLPANLRQALALHYLFDLPVAAIADETGAPIGTVTSWLTRGRREMAALLTGADGPGPPAARRPRATAYEHPTPQPAGRPTEPLEPSPAGRAEPTADLPTTRSTMRPEEANDVE